MSSAGATYSPRDRAQVFGMPNIHGVLPGYRLDAASTELTPAGCIQTMIAVIETVTQSVGAFSSKPRLRRRERKESAVVEGRLVCVVPIKSIDDLRTGRFHFWPSATRR
jgi:hypothetical protein